MWWVFGAWLLWRFMRRQNKPEPCVDGRLPRLHVSERGVG